VYFARPIGMVSTQRYLWFLVVFFAIIFWKARLWSCNSKLFSCVLLCCRM